MGVAALGRATVHLLPTRVWLSAPACCVPEQGRRREEKRREIGREGKKEKNGKKLYTWKFLEKNNG
jgi:hypothetical protein